ncbi:TauD/TfdA family dioxygenase [Rhodococcus aerolatus]
MDVTPTEPLGATVTDLALADLDDADVAALQQLLAEHGVLVLPGQNAVDDATFVGFLSRLGEPTFTPGETPVEGYPDLNVITNVGRTTTPRSQFHTDSSYLDPPPSYTALRAVTIPSRGGETLFTNQYRAAETLPAELREAVEGRTITHVVTGVDTDDERTSADHPVLRRHPLSGRTALYLSTPQRCAAVSGMDDAEAERVVAALLEHSTAAGNTLRHAWAPGDVVVWDNACVLHKADHADVGGDRTMHRGMVTGYPVAAGG